MTIADIQEQIHQLSAEVNQMGHEAHEMNVEGAAEDLAEIRDRLSKLVEFITDSESLQGSEKFERPSRSLEERMENVDIPSEVLHKVLRQELNLSQEEANEYIHEVGLQAGEDLLWEVVNSYAHRKGCSRELAFEQIIAAYADTTLEGDPGWRPQEVMLLTPEAEVIDVIEAHSRLEVTKQAAGQFKVTQDGAFFGYYDYDGLKSLRGEVVTGTK